MFMSCTIKTKDSHLKDFYKHDYQYKPKER